MANFKKSTFRFFTGLLFFSISFLSFSQEIVEQVEKELSNDSINHTNELILEADSMVSEEALPDTIQTQTIIVQTPTNALDMISHDQLYGTNIREKIKAPELNLSYPDSVVFNNLFLPIVFEGRVVSDVDFSIRPNIKTAPPSTYIPAPKIFADNKKTGAVQRDLYLHIIKNRIDLVNYSYKDFPDELEKTEEIKQNILDLLFTVEYEPDKTEPANKPERFVPKRKYWTLNGSNKIQFSQNYISDTWYKGGTNNFSLFSNQNFSLNYKKNKVQFNNSFEWKVNLYNYIVEETVDVDGEEVKRKRNDFRIGEELFRIYSDFGLQAVGNWSYSTNIEIRTQFLLNKPKEEVLSSFLSPVYINMGILGMKFNKEKVYSQSQGKKINVNADISPLSVQYAYVLSDSVNVKRFGIEEGEKHKLAFGSTINGKFTMNFNKSVRFNSRFRFFTDYKDINTFELENELNMPLNRYFSTTLQLHLRYDDAATPRPNGGSKWGDFQMNELLSFGFNYTW